MLTKKKTLLIAVRAVAVVAVSCPRNAASATPEHVYDITTGCGNNTGVPPAVPNDGVDDSVAIQACVNEIKANGGGTLYIPPGTFHVEYEKHADCGLRDDCSINIVGLKNATIRGEGPASVIKKSGDGPGSDSGGDWYMFRGGDNTDLVFRDFKVDGGWQGPGHITNVAEQTHEFQFSISAEGTSERVLFSRMSFYNSRGDCIRTVGSETNEAIGFTVESSFFVDCKRSGVGVQRGAKDYAIIGNYFTGGTDQLIDFESTSGGVLEHFRVSNNVFLADGRVAVAFGGSNYDDHENSVFSNNVVAGKLYLFNNKNIVIQGNLIYSDGTNDGGPLVDIKKNQEGIVVANNRLVRGSNSLPGPVLRVVHHNSGYSKAIQIVGNSLVQETSHTGIDLQTGKQVAVTANTLKYTGESGFGNGIVFRSYGQVADQVTVRDNDMDGAWANGVLISTNRNDIDTLVVSGNSVRGADTGIRLSKSTGDFLKPPVIMGNTLDATIRDIRAGLEVYSIGGNPGAVEIMVGYAAPTGPCVVGSLYTATAPSDAGTFLCRVAGWGSAL